MEMQHKFKIEPRWRLGVVTSRFNDEVTSLLTKGALEQLRELGVSDKQITALTVPGAYEIPLAAQWLLEKGKCDGVITLGAVIRGETTHYESVCTAVERGCTTLQLQTSKPVVFGILTTENEEQAFNRVGGKMGHKGKEAALVLIEMLNLKNKILNPPTPKKKEKSHGRRK